MAKRMFGRGEAANDETRAEQSETASIKAKPMLLRRSERSEAMTNDEMTAARYFMGLD
jgi:hypothetical protein